MGALHKDRFKGFIHPTLNEYLTSGFHRTVFDTREVCVYDGDKLVAVSYFDVGDRAMASLIGLQHPDYRKFGLGIYTMLKEVEFGRSAGLKWYYPGYVLDLPSDFDYKLELGEFEYYTPTKRWGAFRNFDPSLTTGARSEGHPGHSRKLAGLRHPQHRAFLSLFLVGLYGALAA